MEHPVQALNVRRRERRIVMIVWTFLDPAVVFDLVVHLLNVPAGQLRQLDLPQPRDDMKPDVIPVSLLRGGADIRLGVQLKPCFAPCFHGVARVFWGNPIKPYIKKSY